MASLNKKKSMKREVQEQDYATDESKPRKQIRDAGPGPSVVSSRDTPLGAGSERTGLDQGLSQGYERRVRPLIDLIDKFRSIGLDQDVNLPSIVVVGDQSSGKSSVLEAISGVQLPRGAGIVTRCPLVLRLKKSASQEAYACRIQYLPKHPAKAVDESFEDPICVQEKVMKAQNALAGWGSALSTEKITLDITGPNLPDLTLIDLPGIVRTVRDDQQDNIKQKIRGLIMEYIEKPESIVLAVIQANNDIEVSESLDLAKQVDPGFQRTLGVLTKCDIIDEGSEQRLVDIIENRHIKLQKGYIAVKCRSERAVKEQQSLEAALRDEKEFFQRTKHFRNIRGEKLGIPSLSSRLTEELAQQVERVLPDLQDNIARKLAEIHNELQLLGDDIPEEKTEKYRFLIKLLTSYKDDLTDLSEGREHFQQDTETRVHDKARVAFSAFSRRIEKLSRPDEWELNINTTPGTPSSSQSTSLLSGIAKGFPSPGKSSRNPHSEIEKALKKAIETSRGRDLPSFVKYETFKAQVVSVIATFVQPAMECLENVTKYVTSRLEEITNRSFHRFPKLEKRIKGIVAERLDRRRTDAQDAIRHIFDMENLIYTQDKRYVSKLDGPHTVYSISDTDVNTMLTRMVSYLDIAVCRISDHVPMIVTWHVITTVTSEIQNESMFLLGEGVNVTDILVERKEVETERKHLVSSLRRLNEARNELDKYNSDDRNI